MNRDSKLLKVIIVILVIVCLFQGCSLSSLQDSVEELNNQLIQTNATLDALALRLDDVEEDALGENTIQTDFDYKVDSVNWNAGKVLVEFSISPTKLNEEMRIVVDNGNGTYELTKNGNSFSGIVEYPIDTNEYETVVYQYEGETEIGSQRVDWINAGMLLSEYISCDFNGFSTYGNGKLTLAGEIDYGMNVEDSFTLVQLVVGDKKTKFEATKKGTVPVEFSEYVGTFETEKEAEIRYVYMEFTTKDDVILCVYPSIYTGSSYQVKEETSEEARYVNQKNYFTITLPDGTQYETVLELKDDEYIIE